MHSFLYVLFVVVSHGILAVALCCTVGPCGLSLLYMEVSSADPPPTPALSPLCSGGHQPVLLEKAMAPHSSTLAWKISWTEEPGGPQSMGSLRVGQDSATSLSLFPFMHWRSKWQPTPVFLPGESQGWGSLVGCLWGRTGSDTTEAT